MKQNSQKIDKKGLGPLIAAIDPVELCLLNAQISRLYDIWANEDGQPDVWSTILIFRRTGTKPSSPDVAESTIAALAELGIYALQTKGKQSYRIQISGQSLSRLLWATKTALHGAQEQQTIDFTPTGEMLSTDGSGSIEIPELFTIKNNKTNVSYGMFRKHVYSNIAKILHEKHELGEVVLYDALCEELDAISDKHGLDKWKKSQPERSKREAVRQAGIQLQEIAVKKLGVQNYIVSYNTGLMRVA